MYATRSAKLHQQRRVRNHAGNSDSYEFFNMLTSPELLDQVEVLLPDHRERLFPPTETLSMFLAQALSTDRSCQRAVNDAAVKRLTGGMKECSTHTGAYCRARQRLPVEMVSALVRHSGQLVAGTVPDAWQYQGHIGLRHTELQAAIHTNRLPRELSFKHSLQLWLAWGRQGAAFGHSTDPSVLLVLIAQQRVGKRPGRIEPRALKRRPKPYPLLNQTRQLAREGVMGNGHLKKLK